MKDPHDTQMVLCLDTNSCDYFLGVHNQNVPKAVIKSRRKNIVMKILYINYKIFSHSLQGISWPGDTNKLYTIPTHIYA